MKAPYHVRQFFARVLRKTQHNRFDVVAGDANAAANKYYRKQGYQDLHISLKAVMLREMQREVNVDRPFENGLHIDYSTNFHHSQLRSTNCPACCFMAILSLRKTAWTQNYEKTLEQHVRRSQSEEKDQAEDSSFAQLY